MPKGHCAYFSPTRLGHTARLSSPFGCHFGGKLLPSVDLPERVVAYIFATRLGGNSDLLINGNGGMCVCSFAARVLCFSALVVLLRVIVVVVRPTNSPGNSVTLGVTSGNMLSHSVDLPGVIVATEFFFFFFATRLAIGPPRRHSGLSIPVGRSAQLFPQKATPHPLPSHSTQSLTKTSAWSPGLF